jgi:glucan phosphoethanolaminetransferase (alkaline phosphatase superfamily)
MVLTDIEMANGIAMIILDAISIALGIIIASRYRTYKNRVFLFVGFTWITLSCPWWPGAISFILVSLSMAPLTPEAYFILGNILIPIALITWLAAFTELSYPEKQKMIILLSIISSIIFYIIFFYYLGADRNMIGVLKGTNLIDVQYNTVVATYYLIILILLLLTGFLFARESMKSENPEIRLKGKLLLVAFLLYVIGAMLDTILPLEIPTLILFRGFELASAIVFYFAFILPNFVKKLFIKEKA